ncbi:MAG: 4'-phosphopantetheinyl transferase family protein [Myxococcota bacterium]
MKPLLWLERAASPPREPDWLSPGERERLARVRLPARRRDFRRGRWTAKRAIAHALGGIGQGDFAALDVRADARGAPRAFFRGRPLDCELSISHRSGGVLCLVGAAGSLPGCDLERCEERSPAFERHFLDDAERDWLGGLADGARAQAANLLWSAKESALKALRIGLDVDTRSVRVHPASDGASLRVDVPGHVGPLRGRWGACGGFVWTIASPRDDWLPPLREIRAPLH